MFKSFNDVMGKKPYQNKKKVYGGFSADTINEMYSLAKKHKDINDFYHAFVKKYGYDWTIEADTVWNMAQDDCEYDCSVNFYYRIGEPHLDEENNKYIPSENTVNGGYEKGVSVISPDWLESVEHALYGVDYEKVKERGIWVIPGIEVGKGIDGEPVIYPTDFARKTNLTSVYQVKKM